ncbi:hypothetical protein M422DRAFT_256658 [Sphaerobolus stellatus SS14]|uniref:Uncharacterized protein n=1 Tax=Sphaerobolus stellatus (strain SS14) TaxID=990650 RepID=A0A0C9V018_SPHS4|nr:hypothetical protein M422DRAFT_256658 [Sphaerobolus stellatus SS14]
MDDLKDGIQELEAQLLSLQTFPNLHECLPTPTNTTDSHAPVSIMYTVHVPTPAKTGESSQQCLDTDLDSYNQVHEPVLPYEKAPPSGNPDVEMDVSAVADNSGTLPNESTMYVDPELEDLYA